MQFNVRECPCEKCKMTTLAALDDYRSPQNALLAALPATDHEDLIPHLERVPLTRGQILYDTGQTISHAYFPLNCSVSLHHVMENGDAAEIAIIGNEGVVGISLLMGGESTQCRVVVQNGGYAYRLKAQMLKQAFNTRESLQRLLLRFASVLMTQMAQMAACSRHHSVEQQVCRWILLSLDRSPSNLISVTQKRSGNMLDLSNAQIAATTAVLEKANLVHYEYGQITVRDRAGIERRSCACYNVMKTETDHLVQLAVPEPT